MPDYPKTIKKIREENPDVASTKFSPGGPISRLFTGSKVRATANPWTGNVTYFPERMESEGLTSDQIENTLHHELQHTRQFKGMGFLDKLREIGRSALGMEEEYGQRPRELEAFQAEKDRSARLGLRVPSPYTGARDIQLPPMSPRRQVLDRFAQERKIRGLE